MYGVPIILKENWSFPTLSLFSKKFPGIPAYVINAQNPRSLDILVGTDFLKGSVTTPVR